MPAQGGQQPGQSVQPPQQQPRPSQRPQQLAPASSLGDAARRTDPRMTSVPPDGVPTSGAGGLVFIVVCVVVASLGIAFYWFRMRGP